jgi:hypothetical protein
MDNATNNETLMEALESRCHAVSIEFLATASRMRCIPHTIHLAVIKVILLCISFILILIQL